MPEISGAMDNVDWSGKAIRRGEPIVIVLHTPREKCWGILDEITVAGVFLRGLDLNVFLN